MGRTESLACLTPRCLDALAGPEEQRTVKSTRDVLAGIAGFCMMLIVWHYTAPLQMICGIPDMIPFFHIIALLPRAAIVF